MITVTSAAATQMQALLAKRNTPEAYIRFSIRTAGCSGLSYRMEFADQPEESDKIIATQGVKIVIDPKAALYIIGTEIDYKEEALQSGFEFNNPNKTGECGCGKSFTV